MATVNICKYTPFLAQLLEVCTTHVVPADKQVHTRDGSGMVSKTQRLGIMKGEWIDP